ncbi:MAG: abhydrolase domain-containing 18 [Pyrinomonadaceae bacterium]|nr:abhydrolase domain-containing 18 [Pyrinomonadaceae bacterium]
MLSNYFHKRERFLALRDDNRKTLPFEWGKEFLDKSFVPNTNGDSGESFFQTYSKNAVENSDDYFAIHDETVFKSEIRNPKSEIELTFQSQIQTPYAENNLVRAKFFPVKNKKRAVVILPHWNADSQSYIALCKMLNKFGIAALRVTLPYHEERNLSELERAEYLVSPNVGRTLQAMRQAAIDAKTAVNYLKKEGFERVGIVGTSVGSATGFLAMVHDPNIKVGVFNHVSGYFADVVWRGISTYHVKKSLENQVALDDLRKIWLPISPMAFIGKLANQTSRPMRYIYTLYDLTFPIDMSRETIAAFRQHKIKFDKVVIPCGHYTLGEKPWIYIDGWKIISFLVKHL